MHLVARVAFLGLQFKLMQAKEQTSKFLQDQKRSYTNFQMIWFIDLTLEITHLKGRKGANKPEGIRLQNQTLLWKKKLKMQKDGYYYNQIVI